MSLSLSLSLKVVEDLDSVGRSKELHCSLEQWQGDGTPIVVANDGRALHRHAPRIPTPRPPTP